MALVTTGSWLKWPVASVTLYVRVWGWLCDCVLSKRKTTWAIKGQRSKVKKVTQLSDALPSWVCRSIWLPAWVMIQFYQTATSDIFLRSLLCCSRSNVQLTQPVSGNCWSWTSAWNISNKANICTVPMGTVC